MSEATVINESCQDTIGSGFMYPQVSTYSGLRSILDVWAQFNLDDLDSAQNPSNITLLSSGAYFDSAIAQIPFTINGKTGKTYLWCRHYGMTANGPSNSPSQYGSNGKAVLVLPGSGINEAERSMGSYSDYTNYLFPIATATGDAFIVMYPGEDLYAIRGTNSPTVKKYIGGAIENLLITKGTSMSIISMIDICVAMKWLRNAHSINSSWHNYSKIGMMGISKGAFFSLMSALYTNPTACVSASGFSLKAYRSIGFGQGWNIPNIEQTWDQTTLVNAVKNSSTKFYYTHSTSGDEIAIMKEEADDETSTALAGSNFTDNKHTQGHVYPSGTLSWLQNALA